MAYKNALYVPPHPTSANTHFYAPFQSQTSHRNFYTYTPAVPPPFTPLTRLTLVLPPNRWWCQGHECLNLQFLCLVFSELLWHYSVFAPDFLCKHPTLLASLSGISSYLTGCPLLASYVPLLAPSLSHIL